jgi:selenocysteine lyase/cysteine desulfurase
MESLELREGAVRVSVSFYNTREEIDRFLQGLEQCIAIRPAQN